MKKRSILLLACLWCFNTVFCQNTTGAGDTTGVEYTAQTPASTRADSSDNGKIKSDLSIKEKDKIARTLAPAEGMALVYILRPTSFGALIRMGVHVDSIRIGSTKAGNYVYAMVSPGTHTLLSTAENNSSVDITVEAGKIYYVRQQVKMGFAYAETGLKVLDDKDGQWDLNKCRLSKDNLASK